MGETPRQVERSIEFTYRWYAKLLADLQADGYACRSFDGALDAGDVVIRHDVDLSVDAAVTMARLEAAQDVTSTYFVLASSALYNPFRGQHRDALAEIANLGHDVGLHFSTHEYWDEEPPEGELVERVNAERDALAAVTGTRPSAVSFHRPPEWVLGRSFDDFENAYAPRFFEDAGYVADSSQRWREDPPDVDAFPESLQLLTHPGLWGATDGTFAERVDARVEDACQFARREAEREFLGGDR